MKIIDTIALTLIAGVLNFISVDGEHSALQSCLKNGGDNAFSNLMISAEKTSRCISNILIDISNEVPDRNPITIMAKRCEKVEDDSFENCAKFVVDAAKMCQDKDGRETVDILFNIAISMSQFYCANTNQYLETGISPCASSMLQARARCFNKVTDQIGPIMDFHTLSLKYPDQIQDVLATIKLSFSSEGCKDILDAQQCFIKESNDCGDQSFSEMLDNLFKYINNDIPKCKDLPRSPRSSDASPTSVVNIMILLISVITMSL